MTTEGTKLIEQQCAFIKQSTNSLTNDQLKASFDIIVVELNKNNTLNSIPTIELIVNTISTCSKNDKIFLQTNLYNHQLLIIIRDCYSNYFSRWQNGNKFDKDLNKVFSQIAIFFADLSYDVSDTNINALKQLIIHEPLLNQLNLCLKDIATHGKHLQDNRIEPIDYYIRAIHYLEKGRPDIQSIPIVLSLFESIVSCVCSNHFIKMFKQIGKLEKLDESQNFLLDTCTDVISWHDAGVYNQTHIAVRTALLSTFVSWFENYISSYEKLNKIAIKIIGQLCITLLGGNANDEDIFPEPIRKDYCKLIDQLYSILNSIVESGKTNESMIGLTRVLTQSLYSLTMTNDLRIYIKNKRMIPLLLKLTNIDDETIQFHVYRILAAILTEEDIKTLTNPSKIANVFLRFLTSLIDDSSMKPRFHNLLRSLKGKSKIHSTRK